MLWYTVYSYRSSIEVLSSSFDIPKRGEQHVSVVGIIVNRFNQTTGPTYVGISLDIRTGIVHTCQVLRTLHSIVSISMSLVRRELIKLLRSEQMRYVPQSFGNPR